MVFPTVVWYVIKNHCTIAEHVCIHACVCRSQIKYQLAPNIECMLFPSKILFGNPVILQCICYRTRANQLQNESNVTGWLKKIGRALAQKNLEIDRTPNSKCTFYYVYTSTVWRHLLALP